MPVPLPPLDTASLLEAGRDIVRAFHVDSIAFALCRAAMLCTGATQGMLAATDLSGRWGRHGAARRDPTGRVRISRPMGIPASLVKTVLPDGERCLQVGDWLAIDVSSPLGEARLVLQAPQRWDPEVQQAVELLREQAEAAWENIANFERLEAVVSEEITRAGEREAALQLVLDSMTEGIVLCDLDGRVQSTRSASLVNWFGYPADDATLWSYLFPDDPDQAEHMELGFEQLACNLLPFEVSAAQLASRVEIHGTPYGLRYRPIHRHGHLVGVSVTLSDDTAVVASERATRDHRELLAAIRHLVNDRSAFQAALREIERLATTLSDTPPADRARLLHTLKGSAASLGLSQLADAAHHAEDQLAEGRCPMELAQGITAVGVATHTRLAPVLGHQSGRQVSPEALDRVLGLLDSASPADHAEARRRLATWHQPSFASQLRLLVAGLPDQAEQLGKQLEAEIDHHDLHLPHRGWEPFVSSLTHVVRNAVAHGLETPHHRRQASKSDTGRIRLQVQETDGGLELTIEDDGAGIDWGAITARAVAMGLPHATHDDLVAALLHDGLTTRDHADALAGRGVGLSAVAHTLADLGGTLSVASSRGQGTVWRFRVPLEERGTQRLIELVTPGAVEEPRQPLAAEEGA